MARFSFGIIVAFAAISTLVSTTHGKQVTRLSRQQRRNLQAATNAPSQTPPTTTAPSTIENVPMSTVDPTASPPPTTSTEDPTGATTTAPAASTALSSAPTATQAPTSSTAPTSAPVVSQAPSVLTSEAPNASIYGETEGREGLCTSTGGEVATSQCCGSASPFPSQILIGACGCSPDNSEETDVCKCPDGLSFDTTWGCLNRASFLECQNAGGVVFNDYCCASAEDFPNTCMMGACGCSPDNSEPVLMCQCPENKCWNGESCE